MVTIMWTRFILMLLLTRTFGPMITIIKHMFWDVEKFLFIWIVVLSMLASVASLLFGDLESYSGFMNSFFTMFDTGLGNYDFDEFD